LPEKGLLSIAERDPGGGTEESHILVVAWEYRTHPRSLRVSPL
jgi:hypothetical protein